MLNSITESTRKQYEGPLKRWKEFTKEENINLFDPKATEVIKFLTLRYNEGASYGTLNSSRSAISLISKNDLSKDKLLSRFFRGISKIRPPKAKYSTTWDTEKVLSFIEDSKDKEDLTLKELSEITITLLALATAHRLQTFSFIHIDNIEITPTRVRIKIPDLIKNSRPGKAQPVLSLPLLNQRKKVCVASTILHYLKITKDIRGDNKKLFISTTRPYHPVCPQTLGHWIKSLLGKAGINTKEFSAYSTKHAAISAAYDRGIDINTIIQRAGWSEGSQMFAHFYNRPIERSEDNFAKAVLPKK
ncbi:uncharacterized protein LOC107046839 [Diachasma alloeum]|uniref:uncharacterized protein LOC107046839 n=1 Tax=Diachasma alloeum TaxID=454923 RepID=UPI000738210B|nr:uncharacterized protein LOC107046839 [Diachasma alloeum]